jgi:hypothetical protein
MQEGDTKNPFFNKQKEPMSLELEIEAFKEGNNVEKGLENLGISKEEKVAEVAMEVQEKFMEVTTSILENIDILVERANIIIPTIQVNNNEEQIEEEVVVIGAKQLEKEIEKNQAICTNMVEKEIDKPS